MKPAGTNNGGSGGWSGNEDYNFNNLKNYYPESSYSPYYNRVHELLGDDTWEKIGEKYPVEMKLFKEYTGQFNLKLMTRSVRWDAAIWNGFSDYAMDHAMQVPDGGRVASDLYNPFSFALKVVPSVGAAGVWKSVNGGIGDAQTLGDGLRLGLDAREAITITRDGPQYFNNSTFKKLFGANIKDDL